MSTDLDLTFVERCIEKHGRNPEAVIPILQAIQAEYRYLPAEAMERVCQLTDITPAAIAGVSTFYTQFRHRPVGKHIVSICHGTACHVKGSALVQEALELHLGICNNGDDTDKDGLFTLERVACLGCCTLAPVVKIDDVPYGHVSPATVPKILDDFLKHGKKSEIQIRRHEGERPAHTGEVRIGMGSCCQAQGSGKVYHSIGLALERTKADAVIKRVGCVGMCHQTPILEIVPPDGPPKFFSKVTANEAQEIVLRHFRPKSLLQRARQSAVGLLDRLVTDEVGDPVAARSLDMEHGPACAFLRHQIHIATEGVAHADPTDLDEYLRNDGFKALEKCLTERTPEQVIDEVRRSGLRGRGGAGFPTGIKWGKVREAAGDTKYVVCNGDEGDPGAFMDRMLLESCPYRIIEGMAVAARAVGANQGVFYIRAEYPLAVRRVREALGRCEERGLLGDNILGSDFSLRVTVKEGAGAFVCGEETALLASLEGKRGMPRLRPPYPAESGYHGKPTLVNNVESMSLIPWIFRNGAEKFAALGTETSKGTKVFALAGKIRRGGLIEVPMGITIRQIVEEIGGGVEGGRQFKAVQVGGPSGGCVPAHLADTAIDFEALSSVGAIMGSGGLVVLDDQDCMVDIARYFLRFTQDQSCGKCTLCRVGTRRMLDILDRICSGRGRKGDLEDLESLARSVRLGSICGLGKTAPNPVLSTLKYFREEYEAHLEGRCPAGKCQEAIHYKINARCIGCTLCAQHCPVDAIPMTPYQRHTIDDETCTRCDTCRKVCPTGAVYVE
ncbi:MAG: 4Fe-4S dicluster domain-containing protein [Planctomycetaceae bacterium]|nr:4Fe-4S dicluster domain-containing protein [Planctomycetaceae bacterium]